MPSAGSQPDSGIDGLEFATGVINCHLPVNSALANIEAFRPCCQLALECLLRRPAHSLLLRGELCDWHHAGANRVPAQAEARGAHPAQNH